MRAQERFKARRRPTSMCKGLAQGATEHKIERAVHRPRIGELRHRRAVDFAKSPAGRIAFSANATEVGPEVWGGAMGIIEAEAIYA